MKGSINIFIHAIWTTGALQPVLKTTLRNVLYKAVQQSATEKNIEILAINGTADHIHCLLRLTSFQNTHDVIKSLKTFSEDWINNSKFLPDIFLWEEGYNVYSVSPSNVEKAIEYIQKQEEFHSTRSFAQEMELISKMNVSLT
jgi:putative transposase